MGTLLETENLDELFEALKVAHEAVFRDGVNGMVTSVKIDDRRDLKRPWMIRFYQLRNETNFKKSYLKLLLMKSLSFRVLHGRSG